MSGSWDIATATSIGTGTAKTTINGGNNLTKPTQAVNLVEVVPVRFMGYCNSNQYRNWYG